MIARIPRRALALGLALALFAPAFARAAKTPLDDYIAKPDASYSWKIANTIEGEGYKAYVVDMISQTWRDEKDVDRPVWQHFLTVIVPAEVKYDKAFLFINGGGNGGEPPKGPDPLALPIAKNTNSVVAVLSQIPNQPLTLKYLDEKGRKEDDLIAPSWMKAMETKDPTWNVRFPMVKASVRAMDTVQALLKAPEQGGIDIKGFVVAGGSKRGWTTWLAGAVDKRVVAVVPAVIDILNLQPSMKHHYEAYGFWAQAVGDYVNHKVTTKANTPEYAWLLSFEDPIAYADRLTMPKFVVNASGDQFFLPDSSQFYWDDLKGPKYLRYTPNADHGLGGSDAPASIQAFYWAILEGKKLPEYSWKIEGEDTIRVKSDVAPKEVLLWQATNPEARDFRLEMIGKAYTSTPLAADAKGEWVAKVAKPEKGFTAYFIELHYDIGFKYPAKFTTQVRVTPDVLPFAHLDGAKGGMEVKKPKPAPQPGGGAGK